MQTIRCENHVPAFGRIVDYISTDDLFALTGAQEELTELLHTGKSYEEIAAIVIPQPEPAMQQSAVHNETSEKTAEEKGLEAFLKKMLSSLCA